MTEEERDTLIDWVESVKESIKQINDNINAVKFQERGDATAVDFAVSGLTTDGAWHDLDLSKIIQDNTRAVLIAVSLKDDAAGSAISFRKNGNVNAFSMSTVTTQVANVEINADIIVACDGNKKIEYKASNLTFTTINIVVNGWLR